MKKKWNPTEKTATWDPRNEFDPITASPSGSVLWHDYGKPRRYVWTRKGESPIDAVKREDKEKRRG